MNTLKGSLHLDKTILVRINSKALLCLVDGEHYPPVTKWTVNLLEQFSQGITSLVFMGGTEKVSDAVEQLQPESGSYKIYTPKDKSLISTLMKAIDETSPDMVVDLSDEPIVDYEKRFRLASNIMSKGLSYIGADFYFTPPQEKMILKKPSIAIIGTGKRIGKTAVGVHISRLLKSEDFDPVVVCMGRGGPPEPDFIDPSVLDMSPETLLEVADAGGHAASDYWEDALLGGVVTVGCRRCGGGFSGNPFASNVIAGAELTNELSQDLVIMEGSGATFPPIHTDKKVLLTSAGQPIQHILDFMGEYRLLISNLVIVTMCEEPMSNSRKIQRIYEGILERKDDAKIALTVFRPEPLGDIKGKKVFLTTTAPKEVRSQTVKYLEKEHDCEVVGYSPHLSDRKRLKEDLSKGLTNCDILLTEIKAASIDVAASTAKNQGCDIVFLHNRLETVGGNVENIDRYIIDLCKDMKKR